MTVPVGVGFPPTATVTDSACAVLILYVDGVTVTVGVLFTTVTVEEVPVALL
jgi:hypothetical protein